MSFSFDVTNNGTNGFCARTAGDFYCAQHVTDKSVFYFHGTTVRDVVAMDKIVSETMLNGELSHCYTDRRHLACGDMFRPCVPGEEPKPSKVCKSACQKVSDCDEDGGDNGDFGEMCENTHWVVDDTEYDEGTIVCGKGNPSAPSWQTLALSFSFLAVMTIARTFSPI